jgi:hypothetical protein
VTPETTFDELSDQDINDFDIPKFEMKDVINSQACTSQAMAVATDLKHTFFDKYTKIDQLKSLKPNSFINVIGVIVSKDSELKEIYSKASPGTSLKLLNFMISDASSTEVKVAIWGAEAESFKKNPGQCIKIENAKLTNYGGLTISIMRNSNIEDITDLPMSSCLRKYWNVHPMKILSCEHKINN